MKYKMNQLFRSVVIESFAYEIYNGFERCNTFFLLNFGRKNNERQYLTTISKYSFMLVHSTVFRNIVCPNIKSNI